MNSQASLRDQLEELSKLAVANGLYDAHDWLLSQLRVEDKRRSEERS